MNIRLHNFCMVVLLAFFASSCIKETLPECPAQVEVKLVIKDANYSNIGHFPELTPENVSQPFSHFLGTIYYTLTNATSKEVVRQSEIMVLTETTPDYSIKFDNLPEGNYNLSVWGNITNNIPIGILHQNGMEHTDIYTASAKINVTPGNQTQTLGLERTKGKLVVFCRNFPEEITRLDLAIAPVYQSVDASLNYLGSTNIQKTMALLPINGTFVAPTPNGNTTKLDLNFYNDTQATSPALTVPQVELAVRRNEISAVAIDYNESGGAWEIWTYADGRWNKIHQLDIN